MCYRHGAVDAQPRGIRCKQVGGKAVLEVYIFSLVVTPRTSHTSLAASLEVAYEAEPLYPMSLSFKLVHMCVDYLLGNVQCRAIFEIILVNIARH